MGSTGLWKLLRRHFHALHQVLPIAYQVGQSEIASSQIFATKSRILT
jgi:hypothetical protein